MTNQCDVKLYSLTTCIHCRDTKEFLDQCGVTYNCVYVDQLDPEKRKEVLMELKQLNPQCTFPTIIVGDKVIVGLKKEELKEIIGLT